MFEQECASILRANTRNKTHCNLCFLFNLRFGCGRLRELANEVVQTKARIQAAAAYCSYQRPCCCWATRTILILLMASLHFAMTSGAWNFWSNVLMAVGMNDREMMRWLKHSTCFKIKSKRYTTAFEQRVSNTMFVRSVMSVSFCISWQIWRKTCPTLVKKFSLKTCSVLPCWFETKGNAVDRA